MQALNKDRLVSLYRVGFGLLTLTVLVVQYFTSRPHPLFDSVNYFSYFTILSNLLAAIVFLRTGLGARRTLAVDLVRGAATVYMMVVFLVYALLLSDIPLGLVLPWINTVVHQIMPIAVLLDWVFSPPAHRLSMRRSLIWLALPILFLVYTLIRGALVGWYPYPFLDPSKVNGYGGVTAYCVGITILFLVLTAFVSWLGNYLRGKKAFADVPR